MNKKTAIVTGGSSGIGLASAKALDGSGCRVFTLSRRDFCCQGLEHIVCDVTDENAAISAVQHIAELSGGIDILVNCAGFGISGAIEFTELADAKRQMDVNFFGTVNMIKAVLPYMRRKRRGRIINVSSMAVPASIPFQAHYSASKAAINAFSCALRNEVRPYGVSVCALMPGDIATSFTQSRQRSDSGDEEYSGRISKSVTKMEKDESSGMPAEKIGALICRLALKSRVKPLYTSDAVSAAEYFLLRFLPCRLSNFIVGRLYSR